MSLLLLEGVIRLSDAWTGRGKATEPVVMDTRLGHRPNPDYPGHDSRGWRNTSALSRADIVVFGDSQTYGVNVSTEEAWPQRLGYLLHRSVYQMAYGGYGPAHYVLLLDEALELKPKVMLAAYYFGNDDYDSYSVVYRPGDSDRSPDRRLEYFASTGAGTRQALERAERVDPKILRTDYLNCQSPPSAIRDPDRLLHGALPHQPLRPPEEKPTWRRVPSYLSRHLAVLRFIRRAIRQVTPPVSGGSALGDYGAPLCVHYRDQRLRTVFNVGYRLAILDDADPRIREGERISLLALKYLADRCQQVGIRLYAVLIPTKEMAFRRHVEGTLNDQRYLVSLWNKEARARTAAVDVLARQGVWVIDTLPTLEAVIAAGVNPYKEDADGHPVQSGYDAIAFAVAGRLKQDGLASR